MTLVLVGAELWQIFRSGGYHLVNLGDGMKDEK
jgi:hypothetical protein